MQNPVIILGAKGLGKVALDIFKSNSVDIYCFLDDDESLQGKEIEEISVLGKTDDDEFLKLLGKNTEAFVAADDNKYRKAVTEMLLEKREVMPVNAIHKAAYISEYAKIGHGNLFNAGSVVSAGATLGSHCIVHANAIVEYEAEIGDYVQIGAGAIINAGVTVEDGVFIGSGAIIVSGVTLGKNARVGAGSVVIASVKAKETVFGNPAAPIAK